MGQRLYGLVVCTMGVSCVLPCLYWTCLYLSVYLLLLLTVSVYEVMRVIRNVYVPWRHSACICDDRVDDNAAVRGVEYYMWLL